MKRYIKNIIILSGIFPAQLLAQSITSFSAAPAATTIDTQITANFSINGAGTDDPTTEVLTFAIITGGVTSSFNSSGISPSGFTLSSNLVDWSGLTLEQEEPNNFVVPFTITSGQGMITLRVTVKTVGEPAVTSDISILIGATPETFEVETAPGVPVMFDGTFDGVLTPPFEVEQPPAADRVEVAIDGTGIITFSPEEVARGGFPLVYRASSQNMNVTVAVIIPYANPNVQKYSKKYTDLIVKEVISIPPAAVNE